MSVHNHDDEIIRRINKESKTAEILRKKSEKKLEDTIRDAILRTDISGMQKEEALAKLLDVVDNEIEKSQ